MENREIPYLFRTYNGNKYIEKFSPDKEIKDAIKKFQSEKYNFKDVEIHPIDDRTPNYKYDTSKLLRSFSSRRFLLCARYTRSSKPYKPPSENINEDCYAKTPTPNRNSEKIRKENNLLIQQINNLMETNPNIFDQILEVAKKTNTDHFKILERNQDLIKELLQSNEDEYEENEPSEENDPNEEKDLNEENDPNDSK